MRKKFKIFYAKDSRDTESAGKQYKPTGKDMLVMNSAGVSLCTTATFSVNEEELLE